MLPGNERIHLLSAVGQEEVKKMFIRKLLKKNCKFQPQKHIIIFEREREIMELKRNKKISLFLVRDRFRVFSCLITIITVVISSPLSCL